MNDITNHKKHLAEISPELTKEKLKFFGLATDIALEVVPFICKSVVIKPPYEEYTKNMFPLKPRDIFDIKNWFGVPNESAKLMLQNPCAVGCEGNLWSGAKKITPAALPQKGDWDFKSLNVEEQLAVTHVSKNLLYGYVSSENLEYPGIKAVADYMLSSAVRKGISIFAGKDLIICEDDTVEFLNVSALYFHNILIYGNGRLKTSGNTTIHAHQIKHVP